MWHFIAEEDPIDPKKINALIEFKKERRKVVALCLIQDSIDYSIFHYIVEADTPKRARDTLKEVFSEESHSEVEDSQDDYVYEVASDHVIPANDVDLVMFDDDRESKPVTATVLNNVSNSLSEQEIVDGSIEAAIVAENEQQPADSTKKQHVVHLKIRKPEV